VALLSTGDELIEVGEPVGPGQIPDSNRWALLAALREAGAEVRVLGIAPDRPEAIRAKVEGGIRMADCLVSTGGVSVGDYDFVKRVLADLGADLRFWKIAVRPGKPLVFGLVGGRPYFGLPGNPVSSLVTFELFVRPALRQMMGYAGARRFRPQVEAEVREAFSVPPGRRHYLRCRLARAEGGGYTAVTTGNQDSAVLRSLVLADGLLVVPEDRREVRVGDRLPVVLLG
jgi:molybdopterin molybdotransferase